MKIIRRSQTFLSILGLLLTIGHLTSCKTQNLFLQSADAGRPDSCFQPVTTSYEYRIRKDDKISISCWGHDDLSVGSLYGIYNSNEVYGKWLMVNARGEVNVPKTGSFHIEGLTVSWAEASL